MRTHRTGLAVALSLLISLTAVGQQEPVIDPFDVALAAAARENNFAEFDRLYQANPLVPYAELHRLWSWSMHDPIGGFYGVETYERLAVAYPGYAAFIETQKIVDSNGNAFYPTVETRGFLLSQAVRGVIADVRQARPVQMTKKVESRTVASVGPKSAAVTTSVAVPAPPPAGKVPLSSTLQPRSELLQTSPAPIAATPVAPAPRLQASVVSTPVAASTIVTPPVVPEPAVAKPVSSDLGRGIFLILAGLFGLGMVSVMLHTPSEEQTPVTHS